VIDISFDKIIKLDPLFWTELRAKILQEIINQVQNNNKTWDEQSTKSLIALLSNDPYTINILLELLKEEVSNVLLFCEIEGIIDIIEEQNVLLIKKYRPSILDFHPKSFTKYNVVKKMLLFLWEKWFRYVSSIDDLLLPFLITLASDAGYKNPLLSSIIINLRLCDVTSKQTLLIPISPKDRSIFCSEFFIPSSASLILHSVLDKRLENNNRQKINPKSLIFFPDKTNFITRKKYIYDKLKEQYDQFVEKYKVSSPYIVAVPKQSEFFKLAALGVLKESVPPFLLTLQSRIPAPVTGRWSDYVSFLFKNKLNPPDQIFQMVVKKFVRGDNVELVPSQIIPPFIKKIINIKDWQKKANTILQQLIIDLDSLNVKDLQVESIQLKTSEVIRKNLNKANKIAYEGSALHLAIKWTQYLINGNVNSTNTLNDYYCKVFNDRLFAHPDAYKFKELSTQEHNKIFSETILRCSGTSKTIDSIAALWYRVYDFACTIGYVNNITFVHTVSNFNLLRRFDLVWFTKFDAKISEYSKDQRYAMRALVLFEELLFYSGLRESECYSLKIEDIVLSEKTCDIIVRRGKTNNAIRIMPFHILAPENVVASLKEYLKFRKNTQDCFNKMYLFGPENKAEPYDYKSLMRNLSNLVKNQFGKYFVPHLLRHSFQSLLILRNIAIDLPEIINELPDKNHEMFSSTKIEELRNWIYDSNLKERGIIGKENTSMWHISKLMGHSNPAQGLYTYDHSFPFYQKIYLAKVDKELGQKHKLTHEAAKLLIPKMKSSRSRVNKITKFTMVKDRLDFAWPSIDLKK